MARRFLTLWLALNALGFIFGGQTWWQLQLNTGDQITPVSGTGFDADRSLSAILLFTMAALLFVAFSRGWTAIVISSVAAAATLLLVVTTLSNFLRQNIGGIAGSVEKHTGISINPILSENGSGQIVGQLQIWGWLTLITLLVLAAIQVIFALKYRGWQKTAKPRSDRTKPKQDPGAAEDTISIWDAQR